MELSKQDIEDLLQAINSWMSDSFFIPQDQSIVESDARRKERLLLLRKRLQALEKGYAGRHES